MRVFLLDLWLDLREKRLAPVAILLLAGIIAVPIVLAQDEEAPPPQQTTTTAEAPAGPVVESQTDEGPVDSKLQTFSPRDPFEPTGGAASTGTTTTTGETTSGGTTTGTTTGGGTSTGGGDTSTSGGGTTGSDTGGTGTGGTGDTGKTTGETRNRVFTYTVDLRFGQGGEVKKYSGVNRLQLIPDQDDPKVVFLGVTTTGKTAVFLVDSSIGVDTGEGRCRPSADECTFLYLRPDEDHDQATLTDSDGTVFQMRLLDINRISVSAADGTSGSGGSGNTRSDRSPAFTGNAKSSEQDDATVPGETPPGESQPEKRSAFQQFFADDSDG